MQTNVTERPQQEAITAIQALDLESVKLRLTDPELGEGWTREYADSIEAAYKTFLTMLVKYPEDSKDILLSEDVDEFWHTHILQTMKYADDCQNTFGNFLHHNPHLGERTSADLEKRGILTEKTRYLYQREFGSAEAAAAAWTGGITKTGRTAYCEAAIQPEKVAYCEATVRAEKVAYCEAAVRSAKVAYCEAAVWPHKAAYCEASVTRNKAAYCEAAVRAEKAAYCEAAVRTDKVAYCEAAVRPHKAAYCEASVTRNKAAYCEAALRARNAA